MRSSTRRHDALVMLSGITSAFLVVSGIQVLSGRIDGVARSEERRVGKECRSRWSPYH